MMCFFALYHSTPLTGFALLLSFSNSTTFHRASDRMREKIKHYAEIFGHIMRKHALIMRKFKQVIKLIIRPVQCIYMLTGNQDSKLQPMPLHLRLKFCPLWLKYMEESPICDHCWNKRVNSWDFAATFGKINKAIKKNIYFCFSSWIASIVGTKLVSRLIDEKCVETVYKFSYELYLENEIMCFLQCSGK